jgi:hypothetical protein
MVIVLLQGGLGNQMFQYAIARGINRHCRAIVDCCFLESNKMDTGSFTYRNYELLIFKNLKSRRIKGYEYKLFKSNAWQYKLFRKLLRAVYVYQQENEYIDLKSLSGFRVAYLEGYFQSEKYFSHIRGILMKEFRFPNIDDVINQQWESEIVTAGCSVSVHIRRGDYLKPQIEEIHGVLPMLYYYKAIERLHEKYESVKLFVFSDGMEWVKQNFKPPGCDVVFINNNTGQASWKDMALMSLCQHHIVANSSFSWWGAWLSVNEGYTFAPCKWFNPDKVKYDIHDFVPEKWTIIQYE